MNGRGGADGAMPPLFFLYFQSVFVTNNANPSNHLLSGIISIRLSFYFILGAFLIGNTFCTNCNQQMEQALTVLFTSQILPQCCMLHLLKVNFSFKREEGGGGSHSVPSFWIFWICPRMGIEHISSVSCFDSFNYIYRGMWFKSLNFGENPRLSSIQKSE